MTDIKKFIRGAIGHKAQDRIPLFYRGDLLINEKLLQLFHLGNIDQDFETLASELGADFYTGGVTLSDFHTFAPKYIGPDYNTFNDPNYFFTFGINSKVIESNGKRMYISYFDEPRLGDAESIEDIERHSFPEPGWFDFTQYKNILSEGEFFPYQEIKRSENHFLGTLLYSSLFMISGYLRGMSKLLEDMAFNRRLAKYLVDTVGEICLEVSRQNLGKIGNVIEIYGMWDDFAMQSGMMMSPDTWRFFYKPWFKKIIEEAKRYGLTVMFHCCGSCYEVIEDFIEIGIDILDPVQASAKNMDLLSLKKKFGKDICFHGGLDIQQLLVSGNPRQIKEEVKRINELFRDDGGILFGPSHYITFDTPIENVLAIYEGLKNG